MVCAENHDSPQFGQFDIGIASITNKFRFSPKLRVTSFCSTTPCPQCGQPALADIDGDDNEDTGGADFDDSLRGRTVECFAFDEEFDFASFRVPLALGNTTGEDDVFKVNDAEIVVFKFLRCVCGNDVVQIPDQRPKFGKRWNSRLVQL